MKLYIPDGWEVDKTISTFDDIRLKKIEPKSIIDRVKTFEDAYKLSEWGERDIRYFEGEFKKLPAHLYAQLKLEIIISVLNEGWIPDWSNSDEIKYIPYFKRGSSGFRFYVYDYWSSHSSVGSRLCYQKLETAYYSVKQFINLYKEAFS